MTSTPKILGLAVAALVLGCAVPGPVSQAEAGGFERGSRATEMGRTRGSRDGFRRGGSRRGGYRRGGYRRGGYRDGGYRDGGFSTGMAVGIGIFAIGELMANSSRYAGNTARVKTCRSNAYRRVDAEGFCKPKLQCSTLTPPKTIKCTGRTRRWICKCK